VRGAGSGIGGSGGLITDGDLRRTLQRHPPEAWASVQASAMATTNPISVTPDTLAAEALRVMERNPAQALSVLPVIDGSELVGLLRLHDLVQAGFTSNQAASAAAAPNP
jgi:arabinose-5-phosphate isomerase